VALYHVILDVIISVSSHYWHTLLRIFKNFVLLYHWYVKQSFKQILKMTMLSFSPIFLYRCILLAVALF
jgi:hypothetical protein